MEGKEFDLGPIEEQWVHSYWNDTVGAQKVISALVSEVKRLREDAQGCIAGIKELMDNAEKARSSYPEHSEDWFASNQRYQAYQNAYIRAKNMLNWEGSGKSYVHFRPKED